MDGQIDGWINEWTHRQKYINEIFPNSSESGTPILPPGEEVYVVGRSQRRGYLIIEYEGKQLLVPHHYTELMVCVSCDLFLI